MVVDKIILLYICEIFNVRVEAVVIVNHTIVNLLFSFQKGYFLVIFVAYKVFLVYLGH